MSTPEPKEFLPRSIRIYIYQIVVLTAPFLVALGMVTDGIAQHLTAIAGAILAIGGGGIALRNVPPRP